MKTFSGGLWILPLLLVVGAIVFGAQIPKGSFYLFASISCAVAAIIVFFWIRADK